MYLKLFKLLAILTPLVASAQYLPVTPQDPNATFQSMQLQNNYIMQQQMAAQQAMIDQAAAQQAAAAKAAQNQSLLGMITGLCSQMFSGTSSSKSTAMGTEGKKLEDTAYDMDTAAYDAREQQGFVEEPDLDIATAREIGADASAKFSKGCDNFINKEGKLGPWGSYSLSLIKTKPAAFGANIPDDITKWCPKYPKMNKAQRDLYWVWILMSMASSESSCNPLNDNPNAPNGTAKGLFQVWKPVCPKARNLSRPNENIQCAVDLLADELQDRDTLMTPTSKGKAGTYWGPLRSDDWNKRRGGDIKGAQKTRGLMSQYRYCK